MCMSVICASRKRLFMGLLRGKGNMEGRECHRLLADHRDVLAPRVARVAVQPAPVEEPDAGPEGAAKGVAAAHGGVDAELAAGALRYVPDVATAGYRRGRVVV